MKNFSHLRIDGFSDCHIQGIAVDKKREYIYCSFTTCLIKADLQGNVVGSVKGIVGHLGCLAYNYEDGRVYGSLEYKNDSIGKGILNTVDSSVLFNDSFYIVAFDVDKITSIGMDAEKDGIMKAVYLKDVVRDYCSEGNKYGCSGIDGITFAHAPGEKKKYSLYVAYGIYGDKKRKDNDHQILLRFDPAKLSVFERPLNQYSLHTTGPEAADSKYFIYTGNTTYGIQNLEYDSENDCLFAAVYKGNKLRFPNYSLFAIDISSVPVYSKLKGTGEWGNTLSLLRLPFFGKRWNISGCNFPYGSTGMISLGENKYLFSEDFRAEKGFGTDIYSYVMTPGKGFIKKEIIL